MMMVCVSMNNPGLKILPAHRVLQIKEYNFNHVLKLLKESFKVELMGKGCRVNDFMSSLYVEAKGHTFGMYVGHEDAYYKLHLTNEKLLDTILPTIIPNGNIWILEFSTA